MKRVKENQVDNKMMNGKLQDNQSRLGKSLDKIHTWNESFSQLNRLDDNQLNRRNSSLDDDQLNREKLESFNAMGCAKTPYMMDTIGTRNSEIPYMMDTIGRRSSEIPFMMDTIGRRSSDFGYKTLDIIPTMEYSLKHRDSISSTKSTLVNTSPPMISGTLPKTIEEISGTFSKSSEMVHSSLKTIPEYQVLITTPRTRIQQLNPNYMNEISKYLSRLLEDESISTSLFMLLQQQKFSNFKEWDYETCHELCKIWMSNSHCVYFVYNIGEYEPIGLVLVHYISDLKNRIFLSVFVQSKLRLQGLGTEVTKAVTNAFLLNTSTSDLFDYYKNLYSVVEDDNSGWKIVLERLGYKEMEKIRLHGKKCIVYGISKRQYAALWTYESEDYY